MSGKQNKDKLGDKIMDLVIGLAVILVIGLIGNCLIFSGRCRQQASQPGCSDPQGGQPGLSNPYYPK